VPGKLALSTSPVADVSAEPAVELAVVPAFHVAVSVEVEVRQIIRVTGNRLERGPEEVAIQPVHVPVAVAGSTASLRALSEGYAGGGDLGERGQASGDHGRFFGLISSSIGDKSPGSPCLTSSQSSIMWPSLSLNR